MTFSQKANTIYKKLSIQRLHQKFNFSTLISAPILPLYEILPVFDFSLYALWYIWYHNGKIIYKGGRPYAS